VPFFQKKWADAVGANWSFGTQAIVCALAFGIIPLVQKYGKRWREKTPLSPDLIIVIKAEELP